MFSTIWYWGNTLVITSKPHGLSTEHRVRQTVLFTVRTLIAVYRCISVKIQIMEYRYQLKYRNTGNRFQYLPSTRTRLTLNTALVGRKIEWRLYNCNFALCQTLIFRIFRRLEVNWDHIKTTIRVIAQLK